MFKRKITTSSAFSEFFRNAPSGEKKRVYNKALQEASRAQALIVAKKATTA